MDYDEQVPDSDGEEFINFQAANNSTEVPSEISQFPANTATIQQPSSAIQTATTPSVAPQPTRPRPRPRPVRRSLPALDPSSQIESIQTTASAAELVKMRSRNASRKASQAIQLSSSSVMIDLSKSDSEDELNLLKQRAPRSSHPATSSQVHPAPPSSSSYIRDSEPALPNLADDSDGDSIRSLQPTKRKANPGPQCDDTRVPFFASATTDGGEVHKAFDKPELPLPKKRQKKEEGLDGVQGKKSKKASLKDQPTKERVQGKQNPSKKDITVFKSKEFIDSDLDENDPMMAIPPPPPSKSKKATRTAISKSTSVVIDSDEDHESVAVRTKPSTASLDGARSTSPPPHKPISISSEVSFPSVSLERPPKRSSPSPEAAEDAPKKKKQKTKNVDRNGKKNGAKTSKSKSRARRTVVDSDDDEELAAHVPPQFDGFSAEESAPKKAPRKVSSAAQNAAATKAKKRSKRNMPQERGGNSLAIPDGEVSFPTDDGGSEDDEGVILAKRKIYSTRKHVVGSDENFVATLSNKSGTAGGRINTVDSEEDQEDREPRLPSWDDSASQPPSPSKENRVPPGPPQGQRSEDRHDSPNPPAGQSISANYSIASRRKSLPMSELIRRASSRPNSPFPSAPVRSFSSKPSTSASASTSCKTPSTPTYHHFMKNSRSFVSRIAPLHPNRKSPPPPPPPPPPRKKTKKELEMEEKWEEELVDEIGTGAWVSMSSEERSVVRSAKFKRMRGEMEDW